MPPHLAICIGAPKAGTSTLYDLMAKHPQVSVTRFKESNHFIDDHLYSRGYSEYLNSEFSHKPDAQILFEADPLYIYSDEGLRRIHVSAPECRIVIMLRNPVDRAFSEYLSVMRYSDSGLSFQALCGSWLRKTHENLPDYQAIERSFYSPRIRKVLELFPREKIKVVLFDGLATSLGAQFQEIESWLGLDHIQAEGIHTNPAAATRSRLVAKLLSNPRYAGLRSVIRAMIPGRVLRRSFSEYISHLNSRPYNSASKPKLDFSSLPTPLLEMYRSDLLELQLLIGVDLSAWVDKLSAPVETPLPYSGRAQ